MTFFDCPYKEETEASADFCTHNLQHEQLSVVMGGFAIFRPSGLGKLDFELGPSEAPSCCSWCCLVSPFTCVFKLLLFEAGNEMTPPRTVAIFRPAFSIFGPKQVLELERAAPLAEFVLLFIIPYFHRNN